MPTQNTKFLNTTTSQQLTQTIKRDTVNKHNTLLILGLGDLGRRIAYHLACDPSLAYEKLIIASTSKQKGESFCRLLSACGNRSVEFHHVNALVPSQLKSLLSTQRPDLIIQSASLLSPWYLYENQERCTRSKLLLEAGFAAQLPAQLTIPINLMTALSELKMDVPVINCSFPDAVNPVLNNFGLPVSLGIGNAGMINALAAQELIDDNRALPQTFAHHAHVRVVATGFVPEQMPLPVIYSDGRSLDLSKSFETRPQIVLDQELNALTSAHAVQVIRAMLGDDILYTSVPGPCGLEGGWPVTIKGRDIQLNLPAQFNDEQEILKFQRKAAEFDGIANIDHDGTIYFTDSCLAQLDKLNPMLAESLHPSQCDEKLKLIFSLIGV